MSSNTNGTKKRRVGEGENDGASGERYMDGVVHEELKDIKTTMNEMMEHNRCADREHDEHDANDARHAGGNYTPHREM